MWTPPRRLRTRSVARYPLLELREHDVVDGASGDTWTVVTLELTDWCVAVARTDRGEFVLVEQHRHGVDATTLEPAGGIIDEGEAPAIAAARELFEETGYRAHDVESLGWVHPNPALSSNRSHLYFFDGVVREAEPKASSEERTNVVLLDAPTLREALDAGRITHALSVVALERTLNRIASRGTSEKAP